MPIASSISGQVGLSIETTPGTRVAPAKWPTVIAGNVKLAQTRIMPQGIGGAGGRIDRASLSGIKQPAAHIEMEAAPEHIGNLLRLAIGTPVTAGAGPYTHTYTPSLAAPLPSATLQMGMPASTGTVHPFEMVGSYVNTWELAVNSGELVKATFDFLGMDVTTNQTLATPTWPTLTYWTSAHASLSVAGTVECVDSLTISGENGLRGDNPICSTYAGKQRIVDGGMHSMTGSFTMDFKDLTAYAAFVAGTVSDFVLTLNAGASAMLVITGRVQYEEDNSPELAPAEVLKQTVPVRFVRETTDALAFTAVLTTSVATV